MQSAILQQHIQARIANPGAKKKEILERLRSFMREDHLSPKGAERIFKLSEVQLFVEKIFDSKTLTLEINMVSGLWEPLYRASFLFEDIAKQDELERLGKDIAKLLKKIGYLANILTLQEHKLTGGMHEKRYPPYMPLGILEGEMTVKEAKWARELKLVTGVQPWMHLLKGKEITSGVCETLDAKGETISDPRPIDKKMLTEFLRKGVLVEEAIERSLILGAVKSVNYPDPRN